MARKPSKPDPYVTRAALAGAVRFGPQESALLGLLQEAQARRDAGVRSAKSTALGTRTVIEAAQPQMRRIYEDAGFDGKPTPDVALPSGPATFASAQTYEQAGARRSIGRQAAAAIGGLETQKVLAQQGAAFGTLQAERQYGADRQQIGDRAQSLQDQRGAYESQVILGLVDDANQRRALDRRAARSQQAAAAGREDSQRFQAGENQRSREATATRDAARATSTRAKANRGRLPGGARKASVEQLGAFQDAAAEAQVFVQRLKAAGKSRREIATTLLAGRAASTVEDPDQKDDKGKPVKLQVPGIPKTKQLVASVALDLALDGYVSRRNVAQLHKRGLSLRDLGFRTGPPPVRRDPRLDGLPR